MCQIINYSTYLCLFIKVLSKQPLVKQSHMQFSYKNSNSVTSVLQKFQKSVEHKSLSISVKSTISASYPSALRAAACSTSRNWCNLDEEIRLLVSETTILTYRKWRSNRTGGSSLLGELYDMARAAAGDLRPWRWNLEEGPDASASPQSSITRSN